MVIDDFEMLAPMKYYDNTSPASDNLKQKRLNIINNQDNAYVATKKNDGDWAMLIHYSADNNLIRSRSISKVTGKYGDYTAKLPHIVSEMNKLPDNTVLLAEICWDEIGTDANTVGTILRCLPPKAVERQKDKKLKAVIFDVLMLGDDDLTKKPYFQRLQLLQQFQFPYLYPTEIYEDNFAEIADKIISEGGEGIVIQRKDNEYQSGCRTAWATLKMKQSLPHMDLKVISSIEPNKLYEGDCSESWQYCIEGTPVTKPYYMGWKNGVIVDYNGVAVSVTSGLTDVDREWLASDEAQEMIKSGSLYAEVKAMSENSQKSLRHPVLIRLRNDI